MFGEAYKFDFRIQGVAQTMPVSLRFNQENGEDTFQVVFLQFFRTLYARF